MHQHISNKGKTCYEQLDTVLKFVEYSRTKVAKLLFSLAGLA